MKPYRLARIAEAIREVASETILFKLNDPRVRNVTVTRAEISPDLQHAKVYVSIMGTPKEQNLVLHGLKQATGFVQRKIGERLQIRYTPTVQFVIDKGVKNSLEVTRLLNEARAAGPAAETSEAEEASADIPSPTGEDASES